MKEFSSFIAIKDFIYFSIFFLAFKVDQAPQVDPLEQTVPEGQPSQIKCFVPGDPSAIVSWRKYGGDLPESATQEDGILQIPYTNANDEGYYICSTGGPEDDVVPLDSRPAQIKVKKCMHFHFIFFALFRPLSFFMGIFSAIIYKLKIYFL